MDATIAYVYILQDNERVLESLQDCDYDVDATIAYVYIYRIMREF